MNPVYFFDDRSEAKEAYKHSKEAYKHSNEPMISNSPVFYQLGPEWRNESSHKSAPFQFDIGHLVQGGVES